MIILEGIDGSGKSSLAQLISEQIGWPVRASEGPERYPGEATVRSKLYLAMPYKTIFDRHPIISQSVYGPIAGKSCSPPYLVQELRRIRPFIIEASPDNKGKHKIKEHDTPHHLQMITKKRAQIVEAYKLFLDEHFPSRLIFTFDNTQDIIKQAIAYARRIREF